jgi:hypothetical protein
MSRFSNSEPLNFACSRRELPGKLFAIAGLLLLPERQPKVLVTPTEGQQPKPQLEVPVTPTEVQPKFKIGDLVAEDWVNDEDDNDKLETDFGQVLGMAYFQEAQQQYFEAHSWVYYVNWTSSTSDADLAYPTYDQEPSRESDLRLVS